MKLTSVACLLGYLLCLISLTVNCQPKPTKLVSGFYEDLSIAIDGNLLTGAYQFYDGWDKDLKQFTKTNVFYIKGEIDNVEQIQIVGGWPGIEKIKGQLALLDSNRLSLILEEQPNGYADFDFTNNQGYTAQLSKKENWKEIRIVKSKKVYFYGSPNVMDRRKAFVIKNDIVRVLEKTKDWYKVLYTSQHKNATIGWILKSELYSIDPDQW